MRLRTRALFAGFVLAAAPALADDLTIVSKVTRDGATAGTSTSYISSDHARISQPEGNDAIIDLKSGQMTVVDGKKKEYFVITRQDMEQLRTKVQQTMNSPEMQKAQEQMKNLPPDIQKRMQAAMGGVGVASFEVKKTGATRTVAGYSCEEWAMTMGQLSKTLECVSNDVPIPAQAWESYREFSDSMKGMMASMGALGKGIGDVQAKLKEVRGFPLYVTTSTNVMGHSATTTSEVVEIKKGSIASSVWDVPAGYKQVDNPMVKGMAGR